MQNVTVVIKIGARYMQVCIQINWVEIYLIISPIPDTYCMKLINKCVYLFVEQVTLRHKFKPLNH